MEERQITTRSSCKTALNGLYRVRQLNGHTKELELMPRHIGATLQALVDPQILAPMTSEPRFHGSNSGGNRRCRASGSRNNLVFNHLTPRLNRLALDLILYTFELR